MGVIVEGDTKGWRTTDRNQNLVGKLVFWVHFLASNNPRKTRISQECFGALKSDEILMRTLGLGPVRRRHWGTVTGVDGPLLGIGKIIINLFFRLFAAIY